MPRVGVLQNGAVGLKRGGFGNESIPLNKGTGNGGRGGNGAKWGKGREGVNWWKGNGNGEETGGEKGRRKEKERGGKGKERGRTWSGDARDAQGKPPGSPKRNRSMTCLTHRMCAGRCVADQRSVADARAL